MAENPDLPYWLALRRAGLGSRNFALLLAHFGSIAEAWRADPEALTRAGVDRKYQRGIDHARRDYDGERELEMLHRHKVRVYTWMDEDFPRSLRDVGDSPPVLFARGSTSPDFEQAVAVVGTRRLTPYGRQAAEEFCATLARTGVAIISGLARGVDAIAHRVALENGAPTVAVLAGGIDKVYPRENQGLAERVMEQGCLVSEYPIGIPARADYFPRRNRILSGLARATLVVEAGDGSGALHTANWAFEQGRDVFAIPGSVFSRQSKGTNQLIRESTAKLVATPEQLCEELNLLTATGQAPLAPVASRNKPEPPVTDQDERVMLHTLGDQKLHVDELARIGGRPVAEVSALLQVMELKGLVRQETPLTYRKN
jgi:DNA processing protein